MRTAALAILVVAPALSGGCANQKSPESTAANPSPATARNPEVERLRKLVNAGAYFSYYDEDNPFEE